MAEQASQDNNKEVTTNGSGGVAAVVVKGTAIITLLIKLIGLGMAANEAFLVEPPRDPVILGLAAFMMAGATGLDSFVQAILGKK